MSTSYKRIMLIDDDEANNVYHQIILQGAGFKGEFTVYESALDALQALRSSHAPHPCLILLDINMPHMDGFEFARLASPLIDPERTTVLITLSSVAMLGDVERAIQADEVKGYIHKPLTSFEAAKALLAGHYLGHVLKEPMHSLA